MTSTEVLPARIAEDEEAARPCVGTRHDRIGRATLDDAGPVCLSGKRVLVASTLILQALASVPITRTTTRCGGRDVTTPCPSASRSRDFSPSCERRPVHLICA